MLTPSKIGADVSGWVCLMGKRSKPAYIKLVEGKGRALSFSLCMLCGALAGSWSVFGSGVIEV
jgi:hypothetical protein